MPVITETEYLTLADAIAQSTDDTEKKQFATLMQDYEDYRKSNNLPLTPSKEIEEKKSRIEKFGSLFSDSKSINVAGLEDYFPDENSKIQYANSEFFKDYFQKPFDFNEYEFYKNAFIKNNNLQDSTDSGVYSFIQKNVKEESFLQEQQQNSFQAGLQSALDDADILTAFPSLEKEKGIGSLDYQVYKTSYSNSKKIISDYSDKMKTFLNNIEIKMTGNETESMKEFNKAFLQELQNLPDGHRQILLSKIGKDAEKKGKQRAEIYNNIANEFADSFGRVFTSGIKGIAQADVESFLQGVKNSTDVEENFPVIDSPEKASQFLNKEYTSLISQRLQTDVIPLQINKTRKLEKTEINLINQQIEKEQKIVRVNREIDSISQSIDPIRDNWKGIMASTMGSSTALLGLAATGPGGIYASSQLYSGSNYSELMREYPNLDPNSAILISQTSGTIESLLDRVNVGFLKNISKWAPIANIFKGAGKGVIAKKIAADALKTYTFENVIEGVQDATLPVTQQIFSMFSEQIPEIDFKKQLGRWWDSRADVAIGMIPLTILGLAGNANRFIKENKQIEILTDVSNMTKMGINETVASNVSNLAKNGEIEKAKDLLKTGIENKDENLRDSFADSESISTQIDFVDNLYNLQKSGILSKTKVNQTDSNKIDILNKDGSVKVTVDAKDVNSVWLDEISAASNNNLKELKQFEENIFSPTQQDLDQIKNLTNSLNNLENVSRTIANTKGLSNASFEQIKNVFGTTNQQRQIVERIAKDLSNSSLSEQTKSLVDFLYPNLPENIRNRLSENKIDAKIALTNLILDKKQKDSQMNESLGFVGNDVNTVRSKKLASNTQIETLKFLNSNSIVPVQLASINKQNKKQDYSLFENVVKSLKEIFEVNVLFFNSNNGKSNIQGYYDKNTDTIWLNADSKAPFLFLLGHEFSHRIQENNPELYQQIKDKVESLVSVEQRQLYYNELLNNSTLYTKESVQHEFVADFLANRMTSTSFLNELLKTDKSLFEKMIVSFKEFLVNIRQKINGYRDVSSLIKKDLDSLDSFLAETIKKSKEQKIQSPAKGFTSFFEESQSNSDEQLNSLVDFSRNLLNLSVKLKQSGENISPEINELQEAVPLINGKGFGVAVEEYKKDLSLSSLIGDKLKSNDITVQKAARKDLRINFEKVKRSLLSGKINLDALAFSFTQQDLDSATFETLTEDEKFSILKNSYSISDSLLKESYKTYIQNWSNDVASISNNDNIRKLGEILSNSIKLDKESKQKRIDEIQNKLYPNDGIVSLKKNENYKDLLLEMNALKAFEQNSNAYQNVSNFLEDVSSQSLGEFFDNLLKDASELKKGISTQKPKKLGDFSQKLYDFNSNHLSFGSIMSIIFPKENVSKDVVDEISVLSGKKDKTLEEQQRLAELTTVGKNMNPFAQKIVDELMEGYTNVNTQTRELREDLIKEVRKIYNIKKDKDANNTLYDFMANENALEITVNGKKQNVTKAFATYIVNLYNQQKYNDQLQAKGIDSVVIAEINKKLSKEDKALNEVLKKFIKKEIRETAKMYKSISGFSPASPDNEFFPAAFKSKKLAIIDSYDVQYSSGTLNPNFDSVVDQDERELDFDFSDQGINSLSMFNSYVNNSIYKRNTNPSIVKLKTIFSDSSLTDEIKETFGKSFLENIFTMINAFETNGIRFNFLDFASTAALRKGVSNISKGILGFKAKTMFLNFFGTSANTFMDSSIPIGTALKSYLKVISFLSGKNAKDAAEKKAKERYKNGTSSIISLSKAVKQTEKQGVLSSIGDWSMTPMNFLDAFGGYISSLASYNAHYEMALKEGITDEALLNKIAEEGMTRTLEKTFQPTTLAGKASFEMKSDPFLKLLTIFASESRKTLGLELETIRTKGINSKEFVRMIAVNHILMGGINGLLTIGAQALFDDEEPNWNEMWKSIILGPLSGWLIAGTIFEGISSKIINSLSSEDKNLRIFGKDNPIVRTVGGGSTAVQDILSGQDELFGEAMFDDLKSITQMYSFLTGSQKAAGVTTIFNVAQQLLDIFDEPKNKND